MKTLVQCHICLVAHGADVRVTALVASQSSTPTRILAISLVHVLPNIHGVQSGPWRVHCKKKARTPKERVPKRFLDQERYAVKATTFQ